MSNRIKLTGTAVTLAVGALILAGCTSVTEPDRVGLYYSVGDLDGNQFDHCTASGETDDYTVNDEIHYLPKNLRDWLISPKEGADSKTPVTVSSKPEDGQPSGVQVNVWSKTGFVLNTSCDGKDGGVLKEFWEKIGRRYNADTDAGWTLMLQKIFVPALEKATQDVVRSYRADDLVANVQLDGHDKPVRAEAQEAIAKLFTAELVRSTGGQYFCGPTFDREKPENCTGIEILINDVDYTDPGIQEARNEKQKQVELAAAKLAEAQGTAAALVAEAKGKNDAARELAKLYGNPAWVRLQDTILKTQSLIEACKAAKECKLVVGADGNLIMS